LSKNGPITKLKWNRDWPNRQRSDPDLWNDLTQNYRITRASINL